MESTDVRPGEHEHVLFIGVFGKHGHAGVGGVEEGIEVEGEPVASEIKVKEGVKSGGACKSRHVHANGDERIGSIGVIHSMGDVIEIELGLPVPEAVGERGDEGGGVSDIHSKCGISDVGSAVEDKRGFDCMLLVK